MICIDDCATCVHNRLTKIDGWKPACDAFPEGIPLGFPTGNAKNLKECNNGIGYEPKNQERVK